MLISNWISIALAVLFLPVALSLDLSLAMIAKAYGLGALIFAVGTLLFVLGVMGGGDVKVLASASIWFGWGGFFAFIFQTALWGGLFAAIIILMRRLRVWRAQEPPPWWLANLVTPGLGVPYAVPIALGGILAFGQCPLFIAALQTF